ncbi:hypothetical protein SteCoe_33080 [Stentor coeruleus]|uniref:K Homology domain-containing protein n=1 Tax=Stentor coeruleus TaxID=5963 RepID=A0A1R2AXM1_9CILI|nr:hypothetical protein SteCoe_33080 [Stentor coeruleus]
MRSRSRSRSPPIPQFPLILSFPALNLNEDITQVKYEIIKKFDVDRLHISDEVPIADGTYRFIYIYSDSLRAKLDSLKLILEAVYPERGTGEVNISFQNLIDPNSIIKHCSRGHGGTIQILPEIKGFPERQAKIVGRLTDIEKSIKEIHGFSIDKRPSPEPKLSDLDKNSMKFIIPEDCVSKFTGRGGVFVRRLKADYEVEVKIMNCQGSPCKDTDNIIALSGKHRHVKKSIKQVVIQILEALDVTGAPEQTLKVLIMSAHVKELIGPQGSIIKDISKKSGNAKIKVLSDSETEKNQEFTIVNIDGSSESKQAAACKVYEVLYKGEKPVPRPNSPDEDELKIFVSVPDQYVARLIGKNGENVKAIMSKAKCKISFQKAPIDELRSTEGEKVRMCYVSGNSYSISKGVKLLLEQISKLESI